MSIGYTLGQNHMDRDAFRCT